MIRTIVRAGLGGFAAAALALVVTSRMASAEKRVNPDVGSVSAPVAQMSTQSEAAPAANPARRRPEDVW